jgi:hypothetical protein
MMLNSARIKCWKQFFLKLEQNNRIFFLLYWMFECSSYCFVVGIQLWLCFIYAFTEYVVIYTNKSEFVKNEHVRYTFERYER